MKLPYYPYRRQTTLMAGVTWFVFFVFLLWFEPDFVKDVPFNNSYLPFYLLCFAFFYWTLLSLSGRWKRSLLWTFVLSGLMWLRMNRLDTVINIGLLVSFGAIWEYYWNYLHTPVDKEETKTAV